MVQSCIYSSKEDTNCITKLSNLISLIKIRKILYPWILSALLLFLEMINGSSPVTAHTNVQQP